jgi:hypothetical protein
MWKAQRALPPSCSWAGSPEWRPDPIRFDRSPARTSGLPAAGVGPRVGESCNDEGVPTFCRHNRLVQNCPICSRELAIELRPIVSSSAPRTSQPRPERSGASAARRGVSQSGGRSALKVRRLARGADDGYNSPLLPGLRSSEDGERLAEELAFAVARLKRLEIEPPGLYAEVADAREEIEERSWLAFLIAYVGPTDGEDPFASIRRARTPWSLHGQPSLEDIELGPRTAHDPTRGSRTIDAYRAWAGRSGSQSGAYTGDSAWTAERRFDRTFERLALPGLHRGARFDLLVTLGRLGVYELRAAALELGGANEVTVAAKRALGIGDPLLLERRAADLARACKLPLDALDLGLYNWERGERATLGMGPDLEPDADALESTRAALGL